MTTTTTDLTVNGATLTDLDYEVARMAVENALIEMRDASMFIARRNGLVIRGRDGSASSVVRLSTEAALRIGLNAIVARRAMPEARLRGPVAYAGRPATNGRVLSSFAIPERPLMVAGTSATGVAFVDTVDDIEIIDGVVWVGVTVRTSDPAGTRYPVTIATTTADNSDVELAAVEIVAAGTDAAWTDAYLEVL